MPAAPPHESLERLVMLGAKTAEAVAIAHTYPDPRVLEAVVYHVSLQHPKKVAPYAWQVAKTIADQLAELDAFAPVLTDRDPRLAELVDRFHILGLPLPDITGAEADAALALLDQVTAAGLAACWNDIRSGHYGDQWLQDQLSFVALTSHQRLLNWLDWRESRAVHDPGYRRERAA